MACSFAQVLVFTLLALCFTLPLSAQSPLKRMFGVGDDEFFKGAWMKIRPDTARAPDSLV